MHNKVLLISSNSSSRGGGERYLVYLADGLNKNCEVHALLSSSDYMDNWAQALSSVGVAVHRLPLVGLRDRPLRFIQSILDIRQTRLIADFCEDLKPTSILVNQQYDEDGLDYIAGALVAKVAPVSGLLHMPMTANKHKRRLGRLRGHILQIWYANHPYNHIFVSRGAKDEFYNYYQKLKVFGSVVTSGCPFSERSEQQPKFSVDWNKKTLTVGCICQFVEQKNLDLLLDAWIWLRQKGHKARLLLVGDGPQRESLETRLKKVAPANSWFITGWQTQPEIYLSEIDLYVMTSHFEGLPLSLLEAAGNGVPSVVTNFNGAIDIAEKASWVRVVKEATLESVCKAISESLEVIQDLKNQARKEQSLFRDYFSVERMAQDMLYALKFNE